VFAKFLLCPAVTDMSSRRVVLRAAAGCIAMQRLVCHAGSADMAAHHPLVPRPCTNLWRQGPEPARCSDLASGVSATGGARELAHFHGTSNYHTDCRSIKNITDASGLSILRTRQPKQPP